MMHKIVLSRVAWIGLTGSQVLPICTSRHRLRSTSRLGPAAISAVTRAMAESNLPVPSQTFMQVSVSISIRILPTKDSTIAGSPEEVRQAVISKPATFFVDY
jgi:hypothetical protein